MSAPAVLALADGSIFRGQSIGASGNTTGEVVFNTAMTGYQEILTDPSYARQIVTLTYPHIGNTGTTPEDLESAQLYASGLVIRELSPLPSSWRSESPLGEFLQRGKLVAIAGVDTRRLTRRIRDRGAPNGVIAYRPDGSVAAKFSDNKKLELENKKELQAFTERPYYYDGQFDIASGQYTLKAAFTSGGASFG